MGQHIPSLPDSELPTGPFVLPDGVHQGSQFTTCEAFVSVSPVAPAFNDRTSHSTVSPSGPLHQGAAPPHVSLAVQHRAGTSKDPSEEIRPQRLLSKLSEDPHLVLARAHLTPRRSRAVVKLSAVRLGPGTKTRTMGAGAEIGVALGRSADTCPAAALAAWTEAAGLTAGPVFRKVTRWSAVAATG